MDEEPLNIQHGFFLDNTVRVLDVEPCAKREVEPVMVPIHAFDRTPEPLRHLALMVLKGLVVSLARVAHCGST